MEITTLELQEKIKNGEKLIVDFWGTWCGPCLALKPVFDKVSEAFRNENSDVKLYTMDIDKNIEYVTTLGIRSIPTIKSFSDGQMTNTVVGVVSEEGIKQLVKNILND
jgi:thioredoxin 1